MMFIVEIFTRTCVDYIINNCSARRDYFPPLYAFFIPIVISLYLQSLIVHGIVSDCAMYVIYIRTVTWPNLM